MSRNKIIQNTNNTIYELKRACFNNAEVCKKLHISESTLYDWLSPKSPRFNSEFSESYQNGIADSKPLLKDLTASALVKALKGFSTEILQYDAMGILVKRIVKRTPPNLGHIFALSQAISPELFQQPITEIEKQTNSLPSNCTPEEARDFYFKSLRNPL